MNRALSMAAVAVALGLSTAAWAAPFTAGDLVIYRVGDGTNAEANTGDAVFLDEYTTSGTLVQSIEMPTTDSGGNHALISSGTATSEGLLTLSPDGKFLALTGYDVPLNSDGTPTATTSIVSGASARVVGIVGTNGVADTTTALTDFALANNPRSAVTDGTNVWVDGAAGGPRYTTVGSTTSTQLSTTLTNLRQINIVGGQLYVTTSSGSAVRLGAVGSGLPTTTGQTITNLPGFETAGSPYSFLFADLSPSVAGLDTLYVADDTATTGGIQKWSLVGGSWVLNGTITSAVSARGLTGTFSGSTVSLFATTGGSTAAGGGSLYSVVDSTGYDVAPVATATTIATALTDEAFRGIAFVPVSVPEPATLGMLGIGAGLLVRRRRA